MFSRIQHRARKQFPETCAQFKTDNREVSFFDQQKDVKGSVRFLTANRKETRRRQLIFLSCEL
jgi:hypothetical protein